MIPSLVLANQNELHHPCSANRHNQTNPNIQLTCTKLIKINACCLYIPSSSHPLRKAPPSQTLELVVSTLPTPLVLVPVENCKPDFQLGSTIQWLSHFLTHQRWWHVCTNPIYSQIWIHFPNGNINFHTPFHYTTHCTTIMAHGNHATPKEWQTSQLPLTSQ